MASIPEYSETPLDGIPSIVSELRESFLSQKTLPFEWRKMQLRKLYWAFKDNEKLICHALERDLRKPTQEAYAAEIHWVQNGILHMLENMDEWAKPEKGEVPLQFRPINPQIRKEPLGLVLIIGPFNFPFQLMLVPLIGAIAAGNTALIKPSENSPASAAVIAYLVEKYLDPTCYRVLNGAKDHTTTLLKEKFDKISFTGSTFVGRIVAEAAAKQLTPCILELGGLNPAIVTKNANVELAAKRIAWGKTHNTGQACISPNYVLVHPEVEDRFLREYKAVIENWFGRDAKSSPSLGRINNARSFHRIKALVEQSSGKVLQGGEFDETELFISPTLVKVESASDPLMTEEIFGPVLPVMVMSDLENCIKLVGEIGDTPLAVYAFSQDKEEQRKVLEGIRSGGVSINDTMLHAAIGTLPFGGVGNSGYGCFGGKASFDAFVHRRTIVKTPNWIEKFLALRYPPYTDSKMKQHAQFARSPNFDRDGKVKGSVLSWILMLGGRSKMSGLLRWVVLLLGYYMVKQQMLLAKL